MKFGALMLIFELVWGVLFFLFGLLELLFESHKLKIASAISAKLIYTYFVTSEAAILCREFYEQDHSIALTIFMLVFSVAYFIMFASDKRRDNESKYSGVLGTLYEYDSFSKIVVIIEVLSTIIFVSFFLYPALAKNLLTEKPYELFRTIISIDYLGIIIEILGLLSIVRYLYLIVLSPFILFIAARNR